MYPGHGDVPPPTNPEMHVRVTTTTTSVSAGGYPGMGAPAGMGAPHGGMAMGAPAYGMPAPEYGMPAPAPAGMGYPGSSMHTTTTTYSSGAGGYPGSAAPVHGSAHTTHKSGGFLAGVGRALVGGVRAVAKAARSSFDPFTNGSRICLQSMASGKQLRIMGNGTVNGQGGFGALAQFDVVRAMGGRIKLRNVGNPRKYLRITPDQRLDGNGTGGEWTEFSLIHHGNNVYSLRSQRHGKFHVGILPNGTAKSPASTGTGQHGRFLVKPLSHWTSGSGHSSSGHGRHGGHATVHVHSRGGHGHAGNPFRNGEIIRLRSNASGKFLRILNTGVVDGNGGSGKWAQFRVHRSAGTIRLQNVGNGSHWLRINPSSVLDGKGTGGGWCNFSLHEKGGNVFCLRSVKHSGAQHVGILPNGSPKMGHKTGTGAHGSFMVKSHHAW